MSETKVVELIIIHTPGKAYLPILYHETAYIGSSKFCLFFTCHPNKRGHGLTAAAKQWNPQSRQGPNSHFTGIPGKFTGAL
jgi:hypothetical protein